MKHFYQLSNNFYCTYYSRTEVTVKLRTFRHPIEKQLQDEKHWQGINCTWSLR